MLTELASLISDSVRWRTKTGLPRHLIMTYLEERRKEKGGESIESADRKELDSMNKWKSRRETEEEEEEEEKDFRTNILAFRYGRQIQLDLGLSEDVC